MRQVFEEALDELLVEYKQEHPAEELIVKLEKCVAAMRCRLERKSVHKVHLHWGSSNAHEVRNALRMLNVSAVLYGNFADVETTSIADLDKKLRGSGFRVDRRLPATPYDNLWVLSF